MIDQFNRVLVLAPHTDDGEIGAGGFISKLKRNGAEVDYVAFSSCEESVPEGFKKDILKEEVKKATDKLNIDSLRVLDFKVRYFSYHRQEILEEMINIRKLKNYDLVLVPSSQDIHQDHKTIYDEAVRAFKGTSVFGYELPWNQLYTSNSIFIKLELTDVNNKIEALNEYQSQKGRTYCSDKFIRSFALVKGAMCGMEYAESYEMIRLFVR
ncbi:PIG-L deacetylase family protein [Vibrio splendidus]